MRKDLKIARLFGIDIYIHYSWVFIFILLSYLLSTSFFPAKFSAAGGETTILFKSVTVSFPQLTQFDYYLMGVLASLLLFVSVLLHELSHSLVAKARNIGIHKISLFFFGGIAHMEEKGITAKTELMMALAGPFFSLAFSGLCFLIVKYTPLFFHLKAILYYIVIINFILAIFNLLPGFPLDGGRALRAIIWMITGNYEKSTYIASRGGKFFGGFLIFFGIFNMLVGNFGGLWLLLIGGFLYFLAEMSYEQVIIKKSLFKIPVHKIMLKRFASVTPDMTLDQAIRRVFVNANQESFPVIQNKKFLGIVNLDKIKQIPVAMRTKTRIKSVMRPKLLVKKLKATSNVYDALMHMAKKNISILPVVDKGRITGIITRNAIIRFVKLTVGRKRKFKKK